MQKFTVPVQGSNIKHEGAGANTGVAPASPAPTDRNAATATGDTGLGVGTPDGGTAAPAASPDPLAGMEFGFDKFGRAKWTTKEQAQTLNSEWQQQSGNAAEPLDQTADEGGNDGLETTPAPDTSSAQSLPAAASNDVIELRNQVNSLTQAVSLLVNTQLQNGAAQAKPADPTPPDPTQFDFSDPAHIAEFHRLNAVHTHAVAERAVSQALEPHKDAMESAKWQAQYNQAVARHGADPDFQPKMQSALNLVAKNPAKFTIPEAYDLVNELQPSSPHTQQQQSATRPARTLTAEQARQKAEQARRLPAPNGVATSDRPMLPASVRRLGDIMAYNKQFGRAQ